MHARHIARSISQRLATTVAVSVLALATFGSGSAAAQAPDLFVTVLADRYIVNGQAYDDLNELDRAVTALRPGAVRLYACGSGATRAQMGAAHRFHDRYLELRILDETAAQCRVRVALAPQARPVAVRSGLPPYGIDDAEVARWWMDMVP